MRTLLLLGLSAVCSIAQSTTPTDAAPAFDAAVVKPNNSGSGHSSMHSRPANVQITNDSLFRIIVAAYRIREYQLIGPDWLRSEHFDIDAKAPFGTPESQLMPMMQSLLKERFKLEIHRETKEFPVFGLVPAKGGFTLQPVADKGSSMDSHSDDKGGQLIAQSTNMDRLAAWISTRTDRPVLNMTGISGAYNFTLNYTLEGDKADADTPRYPILPLAIQDQLGLRLEKRTAPIEVLVVDHAERVPVEN
jgi:uncharacterized protein (TIGR03435 family)